AAPRDSVSLRWSRRRRWRSTRSARSCPSRTWARHSRRTWCGVPPTRGSSRSCRYCAEPATSELHRRDTHSTPKRVSSVRGHHRHATAAPRMESTVVAACGIGAARSERRFAMRHNVKRILGGMTGVVLVTVAGTGVAQAQPQAPAFQEPPQTKQLGGTGYAPPGGAWGPVSQSTDYVLGYPGTRSEEHTSE